MTRIGERAGLLRRIEDVRSSRALLYVTGDRRGLETQIGQDVIDLFVDHLDAMGPVQKISLLLHTSGGNTSAAWNLVNLLQMFCEDLELIAPGKCMSAGTLVSLGADRIVMTKQATLGPYAILKPLHTSYSSTMELQEPWDIGAFAARGQSMDYCFTRALIESAEYGAHHHVSEGRIEVTELIGQSESGGVAVKHTAAQDHRTFEGWRRIEDE